jgi:hypothetical protein
MDMRSIKEWLQVLTLRAADLAKHQDRAAREREQVHAELKAAAGELGLWSLMVARTRGN